MLFFFLFITLIIILLVYIFRKAIFLVKSDIFYDDYPLLIELKLQLKNLDIEYKKNEIDEDEYEDTEIWYTTASGQEIPDCGQLELNLEDNEGRQLQMMSNVTSVHKCLISASKLCNEGEPQEIWLNGAGGYVFPTNGPIAKGLAQEYERLVEEYGDSEVLPVYQERGVYNVYFRLKKRGESTSRGQKRKSTAASAGSTDENP